MPMPTEVSDIGAQISVQNVLVFDNTLLNRFEVDTAFRDLLLKFATTVIEGDYCNSIFESIFRERSKLDTESEHIRKIAGATSFLGRKYSELTFFSRYYEIALCAHSCLKAYPSISISGSDKYGALVFYLVKYLPKVKCFALGLDFQISSDELDDLKHLAHEMRKRKAYLRLCNDLDSAVGEDLILLNLFYHLFGMLDNIGIEFE